LPNEYPDPLPLKRINNTKREKMILQIDITIPKDQIEYLRENNNLNSLLKSEISNEIAKKVRDVLNIEEAGVQTDYLKTRYDGNILVISKKETLLELRDTLLRVNSFSPSLYEDLARLLYSTL
jgi:hypothetical protein